MKTIATTLVFALLAVLSVGVQAKSGHNGGGYTSTDRAEHARKPPPQAAQSATVSSEQPKPKPAKREMRK